MGRLSARWVLFAFISSALALPRPQDVGVDAQLNAAKSLAGHVASVIASAGNAGQNGAAPTPTVAAGFTKITEIPSGAATIEPKPWTLPEQGVASVCSDKIPFQTSFWVQTSQQQFIGGDWFKGDKTNWTISSDTPGIILRDPFVNNAMGSTGGAKKIQFDIVNRTQKNVIDLTIGALGSDTFQLFLYNDNGTDVPEAYWNTQKELDSNAPSLYEEDVVAQLNITGYGACEFPIDTSSTCSSGNIELNSYNWMAYHVDEFFQSWLKSKDGNYGSYGMMEAFKTDFGLNTDVCTVQETCTSLQKCSNQADPNSPDAVAIYLLYSAMVNLSNFLHTMYANVVTNSIFQTNAVADMVKDFYKDANADWKPPSQTPPALSLASAIVGMASFFMMAVPGVGLAAGSATAVAASAMGIAGMYEHSPAGKPIGELDFARSADLAGNLNTVVGNLQYQLQQWHISTISNGVDVDKMFERGAFIDRQMIQFDTERTSKAAAWLNEYVTIKLINHAWWVQNAYITFMPYGKVKKQNGLSQDPELQDFDMDQCYGNFQSVHTNQAIVCDLGPIYVPSGIYLNGGMARLTWYDPSKYGPGQCVPGGGSQTHRTLDLSEPIQGTKLEKSFVSADGNYTFNSEDVIRSSIAGWAEHGFGYDYIGSLTDQASGGPGTTNSLEAIAGYANVKPSDAGRFSLPVLVVDDLDNWPDFSTLSGFDGIANEQKDKNGVSLVDDKVVPKQLQEMFKQNDGNLPVWHRKC